MIKTCTVSGKQFEITDEDLKFYEKMGVPVPTLCPEERQRRRLAWQNIMKLYFRKCNHSGKNLISNFSPEKKFKIIDSSIWWSDEFDALEHGRDFDFSRPFFDQFADLMKEVPLPNLSTMPSADENSNFTNYALYNKNGYLIFHANHNHDSLYGFGVKYSTDVVDVINSFSSELIYQGIDCEKCYNLKFCQDCENCSDSYFLNDCIGCKNCIACKNLRQKEFYIFNQKVSPEEFQKVRDELEKGSHKILSEWRDRFEAFKKDIPSRATVGYQNENCSGDHIFRCQNVKDSFDIKDAQDARFCSRIYNGKNSDCYDVNQFGVNIEKVYDCSVVGLNVSNLRFCMFCREQVHDLDYCYYLHYSTDCFGCISLKRNKYCILNKQYTKEEYVSLRDRIVEHMKQTGEWGEFFPIKLSPFGYNETIAQEYLPLTKERCLEQGWSWKDDEASAKYQGPKYDVQDLISAVPDNITEKILECEDCAKNYRIVKPELAFYRKMRLPIPRSCFNCRHEERMKLRNPRSLFDRKCDKCETAIKTTFEPGRPEQIYCEKCYLNEVN